MVSLKILGVLGLADQDPRVRLVFTRRPSERTIAFEVFPKGKEKAAGAYERLGIVRLERLFPLGKTFELSVSAGEAVRFSVDGNEQSASESDFARELLMRNFDAGFGLRRYASCLLYERTMLESVSIEEMTSSMERLLREYIPAIRPFGLSARGPVDVNLWVTCPHCEAGIGDTARPAVHVQMPFACTDAEFFVTWLRVLHAAHVAMINRHFRRIAAEVAGREKPIEARKNWFLGWDGNTSWD